MIDLGLYMLVTRPFATKLGILALVIFIGWWSGAALLSTVAAAPHAQVAPLARPTATIPASPATATTQPVPTQTVVRTKPTAAPATRVPATASAVATATPDTAATAQAQAESARATFVAGALATETAGASPLAETTTPHP
jgi:hypothetical protein